MASLLAWIFGANRTARAWRVEPRAAPALAKEGKLDLVGHRDFAESAIAGLG